MLIDTEAIVLNTLKYGDNRLIVHAYTRLHGRMALMVSMPKSHKGGRSLWQPLSQLSLTCSLSPGREIGHLRSASPARLRPNISAHPDKLAISLFLSEMMSLTLKEQQPDPRLFEWLTAALDMLDLTPRSVANFHIAFLIRMAGLIGFGPDMESNDSDLWFDLREGRFVNPDRSSLPSADIISAQREGGGPIDLSRMTLSNCHLYIMTHGERAALIDAIVDYYAVHVPSFPREVSSLRVLREISGR